MPEREAEARIKINKLLEKAGWRLCDDENGKKNVDLEHSTRVRKSDEERNGAIDYLLLDDKNFPLCVLEAKKASINPLFAKEQAREYAESQGIRFVILSNGDKHYFWDIENGNPQDITSMPTQQSLMDKKHFKPQPKQLASVEITKEFIALTQNPNILQDPDYLNPETKDAYCRNHGYKILRDYQIDAIKAVQRAVADGKERFLLELATGLGKTLIAGAIIQLFLKTGNANRVLFLVDRLELEEQAKKNYDAYLKDYNCVIYKQKRNDWHKANIVISTVQSLEGKYKDIFSPTDFDLVISDEAHRSIGGNARALFEYFIGYKLGLTATPKDYIKNLDVDALKAENPTALEKRILLDTYKTFGCETGEPTFRYSLVDGVKHGYLIAPIVVDARTDITTELLSEQGYAVITKDEDGQETKEQMFHTDFEKKFFSDNTNIVLCKTFMENALRDPISGEIGKSIIFCVSQNHCAKITQILNEMASQMFPDKYKSDFATQVTSRVMDAQQFTVDFANNKLHGISRFKEGYETSRTRVCVTVGMMTTGYDCSDIQNIVLMRPIFSPTDFIQIKGRGTRKHTFKFTDEQKHTTLVEKKEFKILDFFANCQYFEEDFDYDGVLELPINRGKGPTPPVPPPPPIDDISITDPDKVKTIETMAVGSEGMKVDRMFFKQATDSIRQDVDIKVAVDNENWERAIYLVKERFEDKPELYINLQKIRESQNLDRQLHWKEVLEMIFGLIETFKNREELLEDECDKFIAIYKPDAEHLPFVKKFIQAYATDDKFRQIIDSKQFPKLNENAGFSFDDYRHLNGYRDVLPTYIRGNINLNTYM